MPDRYALRDVDDRVDGHGTTWWLYIEIGGGVPMIGDTKLEQAAERGWWRVPQCIDFDPAATIVEVEKPGVTEVLRYERNLETSEERYPETLTVEEFRARTDEDSSEHDPHVWHLYSAVREQRPPTREPIEGPLRILDGAPPADDGRVWQTELPWALRRRDEYRHLFPGALLGFRDAVVEALDALPNVTAYKSSPGPIRVSVKVDLPKPDPLPKWAARPRLDGQDARERRRTLERHASTRQTITRTLEIPVPAAITAPNRAAAAAIWDERMAEVVEYVRALHADPCPACGGLGWVEPHAHLIPATEEVPA